MAKWYEEIHQRNVGDILHLRQICIPTFFDFVHFSIYFLVWHLLKAILSFSLQERGCNIIVLSSRRKKSSIPSMTNGLDWIRLFLATLIRNLAQAMLGSALARFKLHWIELFSFHYDCFSHFNFIYFQRITG